MISGGARPNFLHDGQHGRQGTPGGGASAVFLKHVGWVPVSPPLTLPRSASPRRAAPA
jgi:hypothetical protein